MSGCLSMLVGQGSSATGGGGGGALLAASPSGTTFSGEVLGGGTASAGPCAITASGGTAPYTYAWGRTSGDTGTIANSASSASNSWSRLYGAAPRTDTSGWRCVVTDAAGHSVTVSGINVTMSNSGA